MHRTQILLEPSQYHRLKEKAAAQNVSLGECIRRLIDRMLGESQKGDPLASFAGVLKDRECRSADYKKFLYPHAGKNLR